MNSDSHPCDDCSCGSRGRCGLKARLTVGVLAVVTLVAVFATVAGSRETSTRAFASPGFSSSVGAASCTKATASRVMTRYGIGVIKPVQPKTPVYQVLCGPFFGPGSKGMVGSVAIPSCGGSVGWAVFRSVAGMWRLVLKVNHGAFLDAVGSDIRETIGVLAPGDAHCFPSSVKYRFWRWNGSRLKAGPFARALSFNPVVSPDQNIYCGFVITTYPSFEAHCASLAPVHMARLRLNGALTTCDGSTDCLKGFEHTNAHVLPYGQANEWNEFHCLSETKGITCTVIGGKAAGKGFLINAGGVTAVTP